MMDYWRVSASMDSVVSIGGSLFVACHEPGHQIVVEPHCLGRASPLGMHGYVRRVPASTELIGDSNPTGTPFALAVTPDNSTPESSPQSLHMSNQCERHANHSHTTVNPASISRYEISKGGS